MVLPVIRAPFDSPEILAKLRPVYQAQRRILLPGACDPADVPEAKLARFFAPTRGRYEVADLAPRTILHRWAEALTGARLRPHSTRLFRFRHRDYSLLYDDALTRVREGVEITLDLSTDLGGPPAVYQDGTQRGEVPQVPGIVAVVERGPGTYRYDRYLPAAMGEGQVLRLRAAFLRED